MKGALMRQAGDRGAGRSEGRRSLGALRHAPAAGRSYSQPHHVCSSANSLQNKVCNSPFSFSMIMPLKRARPLAGSSLHQKEGRAECARGM